MEKSIKEQILEQREMLIEQKSDELAKAIKEGQEIDEGFFSSLLGGLAGVTAGASVMKAICKALGVETNLLNNKGHCVKYSEIVSALEKLKQIESTMVKE